MHAQENSSLTKQNPGSCSLNQKLQTSFTKIHRLLYCAC